ncbi:MAG: RlpA-like double-psi beta-barrel domain-containing protein [bacterium]
MSRTQKEIKNFIKNWKLEIRNYCLLVLCIALFCLCGHFVIAAEMANPIYSIRIDEETIKKGYDIKGFDDNFQVAVFPFVLKTPTRIELKNRTEIAKSENVNKLEAAGNEDNADVINNISTTTNDVIYSSSTDFIASSTEQLEVENNTPLATLKGGTILLLGENPDGWEINSDIYEFDVRDKDAYDGKKPFIVSIRYDDNVDLSINTSPSASSRQKGGQAEQALATLKGGFHLNRKKIFYFDSGRNEWIPLPSTIMYGDNLVRAVIQLSYAKLAVFENDGILSIGEASWYKYKGCNCAASPDYPKGTKLKVTNLYNDKSVIAVVNDYGPERDIFPDRVADLDLEAFSKIAKKGVGVIDVKVEPLDEICSYAFEKAKHPETPAPEISAPFAIVIDEPTGEVLYKKGEDKKVPIASISKLMTASVFLSVMRNSSGSLSGDSDGTSRATLKGGTNVQLNGWNKIITYNKADDLDGAKLYVNDGETMTIKDIFYSMLVGSANNAAKTLVRNSGIGYNDFVEEMNKKAKEWKLNNTEFKDPTGLNTENVSTALDVANMARQALKDFEMLKATTISQYSFKTINTGNAHIVKNTDNLLLDKDLYITGAKTGFLNEAGYCLVLKAKNKNDGREVIAVVLGESSSEARFDDIKKLAQWGLGE